MYTNEVYIENILNISVSKKYTKNKCKKKIIF